MTILDDLMETLQDANNQGEAVIIPMEYVQPILAELQKVRELIIAHQELIKTQTQAVTRANRVFKRANNWPAYQYPDLLTLIDWLLDHHARSNAVMYQETIEHVLLELTGLGTVAWSDSVQVPGSLIITIRTKLANTIIIAKERDAKYRYIPP